YVLADCSRIGTPDEWGSAAVDAYLLFEADAIIGEVNNGGEMVGAIIRNVAKDRKLKHIAYRAVRATRGKQLRAEPVSSLYQRGLVHHCGCFPDLEDQQCNWVPGEKSPDRLDACVWGLTDLMIEEKESGGVLIAPLEDDVQQSYAGDVLSAWSANSLEW
ncbi:MAG TPA: hypothetical protein VFN23_13140, partial [Ktedonobacteraceae bacterium]|nr:hypothetical protein [Ktedonobacteraceae bacterium]